VTEEGNQVKWTKLRAMEFVHSEPNTMRVKHAYNEDFETVDLEKRSRKRMKRGDMDLNHVTSEGPRLSFAKYNDLKKLCMKKLIADKHHTFFLNLPHENDKGTKYVFVSELLYVFNIFIV